jgi:hypothetical protein
MRFDIWYIALALVMLLVGESVGEWMARTHDHSVALVHTHLNVVGWASFALFGLIHRGYPALADSKLALPQFLLTTASSIFLIGGLWVIWAVGDASGAVIGAIGLVAATLLFAVMFFQRVVFAEKRGA